MKKCERFKHLSNRLVTQTVFHTMVWHTFNSTTTLFCRLTSTVNSVDWTSRTEKLIYTSVLSGIENHWKTWRLVAKCRNSCLNCATNPMDSESTRVDTSVQSYEILGYKLRVIKLCKTFISKTTDNDCNPMDFVLNYSVCLPLERMSYLSSSTVLAKQLSVANF